MDDAALQEFAAGVLAKIPLKRFGEAQDIARAALFLASGDSTFMTGSEVLVDGGKSKTFLIENSTGDSTGNTIQR